MENITQKEILTSIKNHSKIYDSVTQEKFEKDEIKGAYESGFGQGIFWILDKLGIKPEPLIGE